MSPSLAAAARCLAPRLLLFLGFGPLGKFHLQLVLRCFGFGVLLADLRDRLVLRCFGFGVLLPDLRDSLSHSVPCQ